MAGLSLTWDRASRTLSVRRGDVAEIVVEPSVADLGETTKVVFRFSQTPSYAVEATRRAGGPARSERAPLGGVAREGSSIPRGSRASSCAGAT